VQERCTVALRGFKAGCQPDANAVPLFPVAADLVPLYSLSMLKHAILRPGTPKASHPQ
jgi:cation transporter-like permease